MGLRYFSTQPNVIRLRNLKSNATHDNSKNQTIRVGLGWVEAMVRLEGRRESERERERERWGEEERKR